MIFSIQRYLEDYATHRSLKDIDQYAVKLANLYDVNRSHYDTAVDFQKRMHRIRTSFFIGNSLDRSKFEIQLLTKLDRKFKKKITLSRRSQAGLKRKKGYCSENLGR